MIRPCLGCGQEDDHPRDVVGLSDGSTVYWHHDCHAHAGCQSCQWLVAHKGKLKGDKWREHIASFHQDLTDEELAQPPHERRIVASHRGGRLAADNAKEN